MDPLSEHWWPNEWFEESLGVSWWCLIIPGCSDICGWPVENIWGCLKIGVPTWVPQTFFSDEKRKFGALHFGDIPIWVTYGNLAKGQWTHWIPLSECTCHQRSSIVILSLIYFPSDGSKCIITYHPSLYAHQWLIILRYVDTNYSIQVLT